MACEDPTVSIEHVYQFRIDYYADVMDIGYIPVEVSKDETIQWSEVPDQWQDLLLFDIGGCMETISTCRNLCGTLTLQDCNESWRSVSLPDGIPIVDPITHEDLWMEGLPRFYLPGRAYLATETTIGVECRDADEQTVLRYDVPVVVADWVPAFTAPIAPVERRSRLAEPWEMVLTTANELGLRPVEVVGEAPPSFRVDDWSIEAARFDNCHSADAEPTDCFWTKEDLGTWTFDLVLSDDDGNRSAPWPVELRITRGCTTPGPVGPLGLLAAAAIASLRRKPRRG